MSLLQGLYDRAPVFLQTLMVSGDGALKMKRRYGGNYDEIAAGFKARESLDKASLENYRRACLSSMFVAAMNTAYWRQKFAEHGVDPASPEPFDELAKLPILSKQEVRDNLETMRNDAHGERTITRATGGTTGTSLVFPATVSAERRQWATWWRYRRWHGLGFETWCGYIAQNPVVPAARQRGPYHRLNYAGRQIIFSPDHLGPETAGDYLDVLRRRKVPWLHGFPSNMGLLAALKLSKNLPDLSDLRVVTVGAESLLEQQKQVIEKAFGVPVRQHYGLAEAVANFSQCEEGQLHVDEDFSHVEFLKNEAGHFAIIGTGFTNPAFPLFRYDTGDTASLAGACACGRHWRTVAEIDGRKEDFVILPSGARVGRLDKIFRDMLSVREAQVHQQALDRVVIRVVTTADFSAADEASIVKTAQKRFGTGVAVRVEKTDKIARSRGGKLRFVISDLEEARYERSFL